MNARASLLAALAGLTFSCTFDWSSLDPRDAGGSTAGTSVGGGDGGDATSSTGGAASTSSTGGGAGTGGMGGSGGTGAGSPCLIGLEDDFSSLDAAKWMTYAAGGCTAAAARGTLSLACPASTEFRQSGIVSAGTFDLTGCGLFVEVPMHDPSPGMNYLIQVGPAGGDHVIIGVNAGSLVMEVQVDGMTTSMTHSLDPDTHRWLGITESMGCVDLRTSPDATTWSVVEQFCEGGSWQQSRVTIGLNLYSQPDAVTVRWDNLNVAP